jgi:16S rRNA (adenine1518-N6/adenine1519-N6)-dimethyltransferase
VQSAIVKLTRRAAPLGGAANEQALRELLRHAFSQRRKTLARSLRGVVVDPLPALAQVGIAPTARAEEIPPDRWPPLLRALR